MTELSLANVFINFISNGMIAIFNIVCWNSCIKNKIKINLTKKISLIIFISIIITFFIFLFPKPIKMIMTFVTLILICYLFVMRNLKQNIILVMCSQLIIWLAECSFMIFALLFQLQNIDDVTSIPSVFLLLNLYIFIVSLILLKFKMPQKFYQILVNSTSSIKDNETFIYSFMIIAITIISSAEIFILKLSLIQFTYVIFPIVFVFVLGVLSTVFILNSPLSIT